MPITQGEYADTSKKPERKRQTYKPKPVSSFGEFGYVPSNKVKDGGWNKWILPAWRQEAHEWIEKVLVPFVDLDETVSLTISARLHRLPINREKGLPIWWHWDEDAERAADYGYMGAHAEQTFGGPTYLTREYVMRGSACDPRLIELFLKYRPPYSVSETFVSDLLTYLCYVGMGSDCTPTMPASLAIPSESLRYVRREDRDKVTCGFGSWGIPLPIWPKDELPFEEVVEQEYFPKCVAAMCAYWSLAAPPPAAVDWIARCLSDEGREVGAFSEVEEWAAVAQTYQHHSLEKLRKVWGAETDGDESPESIKRFALCRYSLRYPLTTEAARKLGWIVEYDV